MASARRRAGVRAPSSAPARPTRLPGATSPVTETSFGYHIIPAPRGARGTSPRPTRSASPGAHALRDARAAELIEATARATLTRIAGGAEIDTVTATSGAASLRDFYGGGIPATVTLLGGVTLAAAERSDLDPLR